MNRIQKLFAGIGLLALVTSFRPQEVKSIDVPEMHVEPEVVEEVVPAVPEAPAKPVVIVPMVDLVPAEPVWPYSISTEEVDLIAMVVMAEAEGETELGKRLVIDTILNRVDDQHFPDSVHGVIYQKNQFSSMWNGRIDVCYVKDDIVELVKEELDNRTNDCCVFFRTKHFSKYGKPMFREDHHYFSSYN